MNAIQKMDIDKMPPKANRTGFMLVGTEAEIHRVTKELEALQVSDGIKILGGGTAIPRDGSYESIFDIMNITPPAMVKIKTILKATSAIVTDDY